MKLYCLFTESHSSVFITTDFENVETFKVSKFENITNLELRDWLLFVSGFQEVGTDAFMFNPNESYAFVEFVVNCVIHFGKVHSDNFHIRDIVHWSEHMKWKERCADQILTLKVPGVITYPHFRSLMGVRPYSSRMEEIVSEHLLVS